MISIKSKAVNIIFLAHLTIVGLVVVGVLPRGVVLGWTVVLATYVLWASLEDATAFFVRSIPFFVAIPITADFDSLNMWRVLSGLIFLKWLWLKISQLHPDRVLVSTYDRIKTRVRELAGKFIKLQQHKIFAVLVGLFLISVLSITQAASYSLAIKRIIYFVNLSLVGIVIYDLLKTNQNFSSRLIKNIAIPTIVVAVIGMVQQVSTYFMDIFQFVDFWGGVVERNLFGNAWADIAIKANTWFAYFGDQLSLRMFSIFPDSHSFPIFLLVGLPAVMAVALKKIFQKVLQGPPSVPRAALGTLFRTRASWPVVFVPVIFLALILTGTRGIWAAGVLINVLMVYFLVFRGRQLPTTNHQLPTLKYLSCYLILFFLLFGLAYYILATDQFQMQKGDTALLGKRVRSLIDISETSNARRIEIWKDSLRSIIKHPLLGVGVGNFPVVVGEDLSRAKAGSSAHNLYLHIAAELGIPALILALWFLWFLLKKIYMNFLAPSTQHLAPIYFGSLLIFLPWVLIYSLTDVALFDERAFLLFVATVAIVFGSKIIKTPLDEAETKEY